MKIYILLVWVLMMQRPLFNLLKLFIIMWFLKTKLWLFLFDAFDMLAFLVFVWGIILFIRFFIANPFTVIGSSMEPNFSEKDFIIVDKVTPRLSSWERFDVIVFVASGKTEPYIKRIIGLPWEVVKFKDGNVLICKDKWWENICEVLDEEYIPSGVNTEARCWKTEFKVENWFFVLWDNRWWSTDSSCCFGLKCYEWANYTVGFDRIIWKVYLRVFPNFSIF